MIWHNIAVLGCLSACIDLVVTNVASAQQTTTLFAQPVFEDGIDNHFMVAMVVPQRTPLGEFFLKQNQPNPFQEDHDDVPVGWDGGRLTGFTPSSPAYQKGIYNENDRSAVGHTLAQVHGPTVGAFLNSADLVDGSPGFKMMIAPQYNWPATPRIRPFATPLSVVTVATDLQVPSATDARSRHSNTYVVFDLLLTDMHRGTPGARIVYHACLYSSRPPTTETINFDAPTRSVIIGGIAAPGSAYLTLLAGSAAMQAGPWRGWKHFAYTMARDQFALGLANAIIAYPRMNLSPDPADYVLAEWHLNAELHYTFSHPATLGWSLTNTVIQLTQ